MFQHVIVPLDGSALAERALEYAASEHFHVPDPDYAGPPAFHRGTFRLDPVARQGAEPGLAQAIPSLGFPGGEQMSSCDPCSEQGRMLSKSGKRRLVK